MILGIFYAIIIIRNYYNYFLRKYIKYIRKLIV